MAEEKKEIEIISPEEEQELEGKRQSSSLTGFIFSLVSWTSGISLFGFIFAIIGLVFTSIGSKVKSPNHRSFKTVGKTLSIIQIVLYIVIPIIVFCIAMFVLFIYVIVVIFVVIFGSTAAASALNN
ncbi:MAG: hypothetical protein K6C32_01360 [Bacilli bacterium]|nr:hypothetical protein [Bacilli bacterium]